MQRNTKPLSWLSSLNYEQNQMFAETNTWFICCLCHAYCTQCMRYNNYMAIIIISPVDLYMLRCLDGQHMLDISTEIT